MVENVNLKSICAGLALVQSKLDGSRLWESKFNTKQLAIIIAKTPKLFEIKLTI